MFGGATCTDALQDLFALIVLGICTSLRPRSQEYFRRTREDDGRTLEEYAPPGAARAEKFGHVQAGFTTLARCYAKAGPWLAGGEPTYGDFVAGAWLLWASRALDKEEWEAVMKYDEGLWRRLLDGLEEYMSVDEGETYVVEAK
jgi:glutathione S-transferase